MENKKLIENPINIYDFQPEKNEKRFFVDSFRMLIPERLVKSFDIAPNLLISSHGEILEEFKKLSGKLEIEIGNKATATIYYLIHDFYLNKKHEKLFIVLFSAKAAGSRYFEGITLETIIFVLETLKRKKIIVLHDYTKPTLNEITVKDVDICFNEIMRSSEIKNHLTQLKNCIKNKKTSDLARGFKLTNSKQAQMLQINRRAASTIEKPFFKIYNKSLEIIYKSETIFSNFQHDIIKQCQQKENDYNVIHLTEFGTPAQLNDAKFSILRYEYTLRNEKHLNKYAIKHTLIDFLETKQNIYFNAAKDIFMKIFMFEDEITDNEINKELTPSKKVLIQAIRLIMKSKKDKKLDMSDIDYLLKTNLNDRFAYARMEKHVRNCYILADEAMF